jgi:hypothetical protein
MRDAGSRDNIIRLCVQNTFICGFNVVLKVFTPCIRHPVSCTLPHA